MVKKAEKRKKNKCPFHLKGVRENVNTEIAILQERLDKGRVPEGQISIVETRVCTLMNKTLPNVEERLRKAYKGTS